MDLDSVIVDSLDPYFEYGNPEDVITARNWVKPWLKMSQTSVYRFKIGSHSYMLEALQKDPQLMVKFQFEQNYVSSCIDGGVTFWPSAWTKHFGLHCMGPWPMRYMRTPKQPKGARIITFPGNPKPADVIHGRWNERMPIRTPLEHCNWVWGLRRTKPKWRKYFSRYVQATPWVASHWRE